MYKIDIKDLRIGNLIYHKDCHIPLQISGVKDGEVYLKHSFAHNRTVGFVRQDRPSVCSIDEIKPIPLTKEILEKNGFIRYGTNYTLVEYNFSLGNPSNPSRYYDNYFVLVDRRGVNVKYVHQLQNILRDAGIEKEITI